MNLVRLNRLDWSVLWREITIETLDMYSSTSLADQDIFNTVIKEYSELVYILPCQWNVQLGDQTNVVKCYKNFTVKVSGLKTILKTSQLNVDIRLNF